MAPSSKPLLSWADWSLSWREGGQLHFRGGWLLTELKHECGHVLTEILLHSYRGQLRAPAKTDLSLLLLTLLNIHMSGVMGK